MVNGVAHEAELQRQRPLDVSFRVDFCSCYEIVDRV